jgi:hypothetical protein
MFQNHQEHQTKEPTLMLRPIENSPMRGETKTIEKSSNQTQVKARITMKETQLKMLMMFY